MNESPAPSSSAVYYTGSYWNNRPEVVEYLNRRATDDPATKWWQHLLVHHGRPFEKVLAFNCGNGWVERELVASGFARSAVGVDITADLVEVGRYEAKLHGLDIEYHLADTNTFDYEQFEGVDCVVNYAAGHHVARVDTVFRRLAAMLGPDGVFVSWDYTGPHRNQYTAAQWEAMHRVNDSLPPHLRKQLSYPHLPTMLVTDPSEAVHSELILATMARHFDLVHLRHLGGPIAYELLNSNAGFFDPERDTAAEVHRILAEDEAFTDQDPPGRSLFSYVIATPRSEPPAPAELARWTAEEDERERAASIDGGRYYPSSVIGGLTERIEVLERELAAARSDAPPPVVHRPLWRRALGLVRRTVVAKLASLRR